jgi:Holliday junction resolvasome RuvABC endonuclease subunit
MKSLGIDPSSYAVGLCVVEDGGKLLHHEQWKTGLQNTEDPIAIANAQLALYEKIVVLVSSYWPDNVVVEQLAMAQSLKTVRAIMYFEATAMLATTHKFHVPGVHPVLKKLVATSMRAKVFGNGGLSKERTAMVVRKYLGMEEMHLLTPRSKQEVYVFTDDETDAYAYGCWGVGHSLKPMAIEMGFLDEKGTKI